MPITSGKFTVVSSLMLPASAGDGVPIFTSDSNELYIGQGASLPLKRVDVIDPSVLVVSANTTSIQFTGLDINKYQGYTLIASVLSNSSSYNCSLYFNDVTDARSYNSQRLEVSGTGVKSYNATKYSGSSVFMYTNANSYSYAKVDIALLGAYPIFNSTGIRAGADDIVQHTGRMTIGQNNITSLTITAASHGGILSGSNFMLYRRS